MIPAIQDVWVRLQQELGPAFPQLLREQVTVQRLRDAIDGDAAPRPAGLGQVLQSELARSTLASCSALNDIYNDLQGGHA